jgi:hypothetical protein
MTSISSWDRTRRCPLDATAYTTAPAHLARNAALLHFFSYREPFHLIPASCNSSLLPHSHATSKLDHVLTLIHQEAPEKSYHAKHPPLPSLRRTAKSAEVVVVRSIRKAKRVMQNQRKVNEYPTWLFWRPIDLQNQPSVPILSILTNLATYLPTLTFFAFVSRQNVPLGWRVPRCVERFWCQELDSVTL